MKLLNVKISLVLVTLIASSCSAIIPDAVPKDIFVLAAAEEKYCESAGNNPLLVSVSEQGSSDIFRSSKILFRRGPELGSYQFAEWSEPLPDRINRLLIEKLRCSSLNFSTVQGASETAVIQYEILDFTHRIDQEPGSFRAIVRLNLHLHNNSFQKLFVHEENLSYFNANGVRKAADLAVSRLLDETINYISALIARRE